MGILPHRIHSLLLTAAAVLTMVCGLQAQVRPYGGVLVGYEFGVPLAASRVPGLVNRYGIPGAGRSYNHTGAFGFQCALPGLLGQNWTPSLRFAVAVSLGHFLSDSFQSEDLIDPVTRLPVSREFQLDYSLNNLRFDLPVFGRIGGEWWAGVGPWVTARITSGFVLTERIVAPDSAVFSDGTRERIVEAGAVLGADRFRGGAVAALSLHLASGDRFELAPELYTRVDAASLIDGLGLRALSAGLSISAAFDLGEPNSAPADSVPPRLPPRVSVRLRAGDSGGVARLTMERTLYRSVTMLPLAIPFEQNSSELPARYRRRSPTDGTDFTTSALARLDPADVATSLLDIIGLRLRDDVAARIALHGSACTDEPAELALARTQAVRAYLHDVWRIADTRIGVDATRRQCAGDSAMRGVTITASAPGIAAPATAEWIVQRWTAPRLALAHAIDAPAGLRGWSLLLRQGDHVLTRTSGTTEEIPDALESAMQVGGHEAELEPLVAELTVEDSAGLRAVSRDTLRLVREALPLPPKPERAVLSYTFSGDGADADDLLNELVAELHAGAKVVVAPLSGSDARAAAATRRLASKLLAMPEMRSKRIADMQIRTASEARGDVPASTTQDPFGGRGVGVTVEQAIGDDGK